MEISLCYWKLDNTSISVLTLQHWPCLLKAVWVHMHLCLSLCQCMCMCCFHVFLSCTVCTKWCHQCTCAQARLGKIRAYAFLRNNYWCVYAPVGLLVSGVIFYSLLPTLKDRKLMGGLNGPVFVCWERFAKMPGVMTKIPMECLGGGTVLKEIIKQVSSCCSSNCFSFT